MTGLKAAGWFPDKGLEEPLMHIRRWDIAVQKGRRQACDCAPCLRTRAARGRGRDRNARLRSDRSGQAAHDDKKERAMTRMFWSLMITSEARIR